METNSNLIKAMENIEEKKGYLEYSQKAEKKAKWKFGAGLLGAAYLGVRAFVGPDIVDNLFDFPNLLSVADMTMILFTASSGVVGGLDYRTKYKERKEYEKDFRNAKFEYRNFMEEEYPRERRSLKTQNNQKE